MKRALSAICAVILAFTVTGCAVGGDGLEGGGGSMQPIVYEMSKNTKRVGRNADLVLPVQSSAVTGAPLKAYVSLDVDVDNYNYYVVDWGDGTWSYNGPYAHNETYRVLGEVYHTYKKAGTYSVTAAGVNLAAGKLYGWTEPQLFTVSGEDFEGEMIQNVTPMSSSSRSESTTAAHVTDGNNDTYWQSAEAPSIASEEYVGYLFDKTYTLDSIEIKTPQDAAVFPSNLAVEYTTDGGKSWYSLPHYYYILPNTVNYNVIMNFPNPKGATLVLPLDSIAANGIRVTSKMFPLSGSGVKTFSVSELRVYGTEEPLFFTSRGGTFDADLNNFWTIFGTAKTEPRMFNSLRGGATNINPFRSGQTMLASTEWFHWDSRQLLWSGYDDAVHILVNALKNARYGGDGWYYDEGSASFQVNEEEYKTNPENDGYIWTTESSPEHLAGSNHYTTNSSFIIAARNYLLTGNNTKGFLETKNAQGQVMADKIRKAADYMLEKLNGKSGLMTIFDPRCDGTVNGASANYWDSLTFFGYQSSYENILFYRAMQCMADIENYFGNKAQASYYNGIAAKTKQVFNDTFWDPEKGRYITSVNVNGERLDFGVTFTNFMAASMGLANEEQLDKIYSWLDGKRAIAGDTSTGEDIYHFVVSARSNTVAVESQPVNGKHYWWYNGHPFNDVTPGNWGEYGNQMQNGGSIFYISHYDVSGRAALDPNDAFNRFDTIMEEFHKDQLRRDPYTKWSSDAGFQLSIVGEFPESGLVPLTFVTDFVGITPEAAGLKISPKLPDSLSYAGVNAYRYGNRVYSIEVNRDLTSPQVTRKNGKYYLRLPANKTYYITLENKLIEGGAV